MTAAPIDFIRGLVDRYGHTQRAFIALSDGVDPFLTGRPADIEKAKWFADVYEALGRPRIHLRDIHYQVVARGLSLPDDTPYAGEAADWTTLYTASSKARELGLVSPFAFLDKRTRREDTNDTLRDHIEPEVGGAYAPDLDLPDLSLPEWKPAEAPRLFEEPTALSLQPVTVELWIEKESSTLENELLPLAEKHGIRVVVGVGFQSETAAANLVTRAIDDGRDRVVLYLADADKKGEAMAMATARHIEFLCRHWLAEHEPETVVPRIAMDRLALTLGQVAAIEATIGREIPRSPDVARAENRVELQALPAFAPGWLRDELERRLVEITDEDLDHELLKWEGEAQDVITAEWETETEDVRLRIGVAEQERIRVLKRFDLDALRDTLKEIEAERQEILTEYERVAENFDPELPDLPEGYVDLDDGRDWLLDTDREYIDQINAYRRHEPVDAGRGRGGREPLVLVERTCEGTLPDGTRCGGSLAGKMANALFCTDCRRNSNRGRTYTKKGWRP